MEHDLEAILIPLAFFALVGLVVVQSRLRAHHETQRRFELGVRTLERFADPEALIKFLGSDPGQEFMRLLDSGEPPLQRRLLRSVQFGIVFAVLGLATLLLAALAEGYADLLIAGTMALALGAALLGGAAAAWALARRWQLIGDPRGRPRGASPYREANP